MSEIKNFTDEDIVNRFFSGTTCGRKEHKMILRGKHFSIIKHNSHAEYTGRFSGVVNCESAFFITRNGAPHYNNSRDFSPEYKEIFTGGRLNKKRLAYLTKVLAESEQMNSITILTEFQE